MKYPVKKVFVTQEFGDNPANYARFGYKGHNGIDYRAFNPDGNRCYTGDKSEVFAPHNGKVIENAFDADGYGNYIKIENEVEGSILAHLSSRSERKIGESVNAGDLIGYQGTTGNSTAIHLHWGYYRHPRDRQNGYGGMIDQTPFLVEVQPKIEVVDPKLVELQKEIDDKNVQIGNLQGQVNGLTKDNADLSHKLGESNAQLLAVSTELDQKNQALIRELESQHDFADSASRASDERDVIKKVLSDMLWEVEDELKLPHPNDGIDTRVSVALGALKANVESKTVIKGLGDYSIIVKIGGILWLK